MTGRNRILLAVGAVLLTLVVTVAAVAAGGARASAAANDGALDSAALAATGLTDPGDRCAEYDARLAANLGITVERLREARKQTALQEVDAAQAAGRITPEQAQRLRDRINSGDGGLLCGRFGRSADGAGAHNFFDGKIADAAAAYFGISRDQLLRDLRERGSLQGVAAKYGKDNADGKAGLEAAMEGTLRQSLADRGVSADRIEQIASRFEQAFDRLYTGQIGQKGNRAPGGFGRGTRHAPAQPPAGGQ